MRKCISNHHNPRLTKLIIKLQANKTIYLRVVETLSVFMFSVNVSNIVYVEVMDFQEHLFSRLNVTHLSCLTST